MRGSEITRVALLKTLSPLFYKAERLLTDYPLRYSSGYRSSVVPLQLLSRPICIQAESHLSIRSTYTVGCSSWTTSHLYAACKRETVCLRAITYKSLSVRWTTPSTRPCGFLISDSQFPAYILCSISQGYCSGLRSRRTFDPRLVTLPRLIHNDD